LATVIIIFILAREVFMAKMSLVLNLINSERGFSFLRHFFQRAEV
jgi:hypothetical protein